MRDCRQMKHAVRRAAECHINGKCVHQRLARHDITRSDIAAQQLHYSHARMLCKLNTGRIDSGNSAVAAQTHTERFGQAVHGVSSVHARA